MEETRRDYVELRERRANREKRTDLLSLEAARSQRFDGQWSEYVPSTPDRTGIHLIDDVTVADLRPYIDWTPFLKTWELHGQYPAILDDAVVGEQARILLDDAALLLDQMARGRGPGSSSHRGSLPCLQRRRRRARVLDIDPLVRRRMPRSTPCASSSPRTGEPTSPCRTSSPRPAARQDWMGAFAVTAGGRVEELAKQFEAAHDDYHAIMAKALADRIAEAFAEYVTSASAEDLWGYAADEKLGNRG